MVESIAAIQSLRLANFFEDLYYGRGVIPSARIYFGYPQQFHNTAPNDWLPLTEGGLIPMVDNGNFDLVCLYNPATRKFVLKAVEEPNDVCREFDYWQQFLAYEMLEISSTGAREKNLVEIGKLIDFHRIDELLLLLKKFDSGIEPEQIDELAQEFVRTSGG